MPTKWIIVADSNRARLFQTSAGLDELTELEDFLNPAGRMANRELRHDALGRFCGRGERKQSNTAEPNISADEHSDEFFSKTITRYLKKSHDNHRYDELSIVAATSFMGLLRKQLPKQITKCVKRELTKDVSSLSTAKIKQYLKTNLY